MLDYPSELREKVIIVAIAPGAYIYKETCAQVIHYRNESAWRDLIPRLDRVGAEREKETIVDLPSHPNADLIDHKFQSPTYWAVLKNFRERT